MLFLLRSAASEIKWRAINLVYFQHIAPWSSSFTTAGIVAIIGDVIAICAPASQSSERVMQLLFSIRHAALTGWLSTKATALRERAVRLLVRTERDGLLREADRRDRDAQVDAYLKSKELKPPT